MNNKSIIQISDKDTPKKEAKQRIEATNRNDELNQGIESIGRINEANRLHGVNEWNRRIASINRSD